MGRSFPFTAPDRVKERRNVVLKAMADAGFVSAEAAERSAKEPLTAVARALDAEAPYFVDYIGETLGNVSGCLKRGAIYEGWLKPCGRTSTFRN